MRIVSWNVNGIRSAERKGFLPWFASDKPDILGLQETKVDDFALPLTLRQPKGYESTWVFPKRKGYSGVALFHKKPAKKIYDALGVPEYDEEGRMVGIELDDMIVFSVYFPKGSGVLRDNSRVPYKLGFYDAFFEYANKLKKKRKKPLVVMGDFNTAHENIDLVNWKSNAQNSGFLPEERAAYGKHLKNGYLDTFRHQHPKEAKYSWWSQRAGARARNIGWRIDCVWISEALEPRLKESFILDQVTGSDHCPIGITLRN
jgi:exodeoxyribonuclease-3